MDQVQPQADQQPTNNKFAKAFKRIWDGPSEEGEFAPGLEVENVFGEAIFGDKKKEPFEEKKPERRSPEPQSPPPAPTPPPQRRFDAEPLASSPTPLRPAPVRTPEAYHQQPLVPDGETTTIAKGAVLVGDLTCGGNVDMFGSITGNLSAQGDVRLTGRMEGNVRAGSLTMVSCAIQGNVNANGAVSMDGDSVLIGDMEADSITTDGRIKGNLRAGSSIVCQGGAYLMGDVTAASINVASGARIQGKMEISDGSNMDIQIPQR